MKSVKFLALGLAVLLPVVGSAQTLLSAGRSVQDQSISLISWGSGTVGESDEIAFEGTTSIRVSTRNFFQGGILRWGQAVNLSAAANDPNNLLLFTIHVPGGGAAAGGGPGGRPGMGGPGGPGGPGIGAAGGGAPGAATGLGGGAAAGGASTGGLPVMRTMRVIVTTTDGLRSEAFLDITSSGTDANGWRNVGIPIQAIRGFDRTNKEVQEIAFAGDTSVSFFVGEIRVLNDRTPIQGDVNVRELNLAFGDQFTFIANGFAGPTQLVYEWDFDATDGVNVDATGQSVTRRFRRPGNFTITLTIRDAYGLKEPFRTTINVTVNP